MAETTENLCSKVLATDQIMAITKGALVEPVVSRQTVTAQSLVRIASITQVEVNLVGEGAAYLRQPIASNDRLAFATVGTLTVSDIFTSTQRLEVVADAEVVEAAGASEALSFTVSSAQQDTLQEAIGFSDTLIPGSTQARITQGIAAGDRVNIQSQTVISDVVGVRGTFIGSQQSWLQERLSWVEAQSAITQGKVISRWVSRQNITPQTVNPVQTLHEAGVFAETLWAQGGLSIVFVREPIVSEARVYQLGQPGWLATTENWAHGWHDLPSVDWADGSRYRAGLNEYAVDRGDGLMGAEIELDRITSYEGAQARPGTGGKMIRLDTLWITDAPARVITVTARTQTKTATKRGQSSRVVFGRGLASPYFDMRISGFDLIRRANLQINVSHRRK